MAFVNEFVPEDQKDKFDPEVFNLGPAFPPARPYRWTIDRERDVFLILAGSTGGGGQGDGYIPPKFYTLCIQGKLVKFDARITGTGNLLKGDAEVNWEVFNLRIPPELETERTEVIALIREVIKAKAMDEKGKPAGQYKSINITFN